ncbi:MAG: efflux RND transporter permease subunit [Candidatus Omnitrophica bacterium]|nr:efflux RND transporter permease subunit [Candidatus Omnitrophota bacterium]
MGLIPLAFSTGEGSESWRPLGMTMLGGLSFSTHITLLYVPNMYSIFEGLGKRNKGGGRYQ